MPPKAKFTHDEIVDAAFEIVRNKGFSALTARALGACLGSSARPIFTVFESMEEVQQATVNKAKSLYGEYIQRGLADTPAFKGVGMQYIIFAINEPELFRLLFMKESGCVPELSMVLQIIDDNYEKILSSVMDGYGLTRETAEKLYRHLWIYSHGIAALCATKMCRFTAEEISVMLTEVFIGLLKQAKG